jgi:hypothetical protein
MEAQIIDDTVVIAMDHNEVSHALLGQAVIDRGNPFDSSAKVEVRPIQEIEPEYEPVKEFLSDEYFKRLEAVKPVVHYLLDQDIIIYIQPEYIRDARVSAINIARAAIQAMVPPEDRNSYMQHFPYNGIQLRLDGRIPDHL